MGTPRIEVAVFAGACYGVERALDMALSAADGASQPVHTLGPLIHNPLVVRDLDARGVHEAADLNEAGSGTLILRTHGVPVQLVEEARARGFNILDATCPYVKKVHLAAERLVAKGYQLIVVGESGHPEVEGIVSHADGQALVVTAPEDLHDVKLGPRVGVVVQTTQTAQTLERIAAYLAARVRELHIVNTICAATSERQNAARELARRADVMIVIGGKNSANTCRLAEICAAGCARTHHIEDATELEPAWLADADLIGITAGASTPAAHIERTCDAIRAHIGAAR